MTTDVWPLHLLYSVLCVGGHKWTQLESSSWSRQNDGAAAEADRMMEQQLKRTQSGSNS